MADNEKDKFKGADGAQGDDFYEQEYEKERQTEHLNASQPSPTRQRSGYDEYYGGLSENRGAAESDGAKTKPNISKIINCVVIALVVIAVYILGVCSYTLFNPETQMVNKALKILEQNYLFEYDKDILAYYAAAGMTDALDRYSHILTPLEYYELINATDSDTKLYGISYYRVTDPDDEYEYTHWEVYSVALDSNADYAGVREGDIIKSINGVSITGGSEGAKLSNALNKTSNDVSEFVFIRNGAEVKLTIKKEAVKARYVEYFFIADDGKIYTNFRDKEHLISTQAYDKDTPLSNFPHVEAYGIGDLVKNNKTGYLRLHNFLYTEDERSGSELDFDKAMDRFKTAYNGNGKLVLDLRGNGGGYNDYCVNVASYLLYNGKPGEKLTVYSLINKKGETISVNKATTRYDKYFSTDNYKTNPNVILLTDGNSASASEMLTGAALVYGTVIQVGTQTYGKGISQTVQTLMSATIIVDGKKVQSYYALYYTFAYFYTPDLEGSTSAYNKYCNHDVVEYNSAGEQINVIKKGYVPQQGYVIKNIKDIVAKINEMWKQSPSAE